MTLLEIGSILAVLALALTCWLISFARSRRIVEDWAKDGGMVLERREFHMLGRGPFDWVSRTQFLYSVRVRDQKDQVRDAWLKCGHAIFGMFSRQMDVKWVDVGKSAFLDR